MLSMKIKDVIFNSPIIAASGTFGYGNEVEKFIDLSKLGAVITKSITLHPREGNPSPRIHGSDSGMINSIGLANVGVEKFCKDKVQSLNNLKTKYIVSIAGSTIDEYVEILTKIDRSNGNHIGYEINISCPNVKQGGIEFGVNTDIVSSLTRQLRQLTQKLLIIKLTPNVTDISEIALSAQEAGADAISAVNTFQGLAIDYKTGKMILSTTFGGVSGSPIKPLALAKVHKIYNKINIPIIGMGGICTFEDTIEFFRVGSSMVQIGTLNYRDPSLIVSIYDRLNEFMLKNNFSSISDLVGNFHN
ncbi:MAG: dihydroorotate dehydrogenase B catalytic subunit [Candidatus Marinimicrobia bacterium]|nr:dihydroorotate dehydrogenase B catalytic subunit [Candidatus Neomarinimicrobiota bacterium]